MPATAVSMSTTDHIAVVERYAAHNYHPLEVVLDRGEIAEAVFDVTQLPSGEIFTVRLKRTSGNTALDAVIERALTTAKRAGAGYADVRIVRHQREALYAFKANLRVVQTADAMLGALLDTRA